MPPKVEEGVTSSHAHRRRGVSPNWNRKQQQRATQTSPPDGRTVILRPQSLLEGKYPSNYTSKQKV